MNNCGTCKHWMRIADLENVNWQPYFYGLPEAEAEQANQVYGKCKEIDLPDPTHDEVRSLAKQPIAFTEDGSQYMAILWTHETFGCTLWAESK